ncbi:glycoside hydrolase family 44 protein [Paenibacillus sp. H1-7]|uniref:glycoside hydrolase family 44 protein n=1 Tax=Paenibacillus sp. H1-7 TaxID=2282849 RepID=UPI001EF9679A|nr:glycoside hydrolase family 44 protein [Paenibacillus sp. H1-7]
MNASIVTCRKVRLALGMAFLLLFHTFTFFIPVPSAQAAIDFSVSAKAAPASVEAGSKADVFVSVKTSESADVLMDVEFFNSSLQNVGQLFQDNIKLTAGVEKTVPFQWRVPEQLPEGEYIVSFGIFGAGWGGHINKWYPGVTKITVKKGTPSVSFTTGAAVAPDSVRSGGEVSIDTSVTANVYAEALVEVSVIQPDGTKVLTWPFVDSFTANQAKHFPVKWTAPANAPAGQYKVGIGVYSPDRTKTYTVNDSAALFTVHSDTQPVPTVPTNVKAIAAADSITVTWDSAGQATGYDVEVDGTTTVSHLAGTSYVHSGLAPDTEHKYRVRAKNGTVTGAWSSEVAAKVPPAASQGSIKVITTTGQNQSSPSITPEFKVTNTGTTAIDLKNLKIRYYFTADFINEEEKSFAIGFYSMVKWSSFPTANVITDFVKMPVPASNATHYLEIGFKDNAGVIQPGDDLLFSGWMNKSDWSSFDQTNDYSFLNSSTAAESTRTTLYKDGVLVWGTEPAPLDIPPFPAQVNSSSTDTSITLKWDDVPGATGYEVYADGVTTTVTANTFVYDYLKPGTLHTFKLRTIKGNATSLWSSLFAAKTTGEQQLPAPLGIRAEKSESSIKVTWKALQELVTGYEIEVDGAVVPTGTTLSYTQSGLTPASLHTFRIRAVDGSTLGPWSDTIKINTLRTVAGTFDVDFRIDPTEERAPISPYIYGSNEDLTGTENITARRAGGNRFSAYNWENNASNSGDDDGFVNDSFVPWYYGGIPVSESAKWDIPGIAAIGFHQKSLAKGAYTLWTLPTAGYAAKDKSSTPVTPAETAPSSRWVDVKAAKGAPFSLTPDLTDNVAYNDEFVNLLVNKFGPASSATGIKGYEIDNEPGLWKKTHAYMHPDIPKGVEVLNKSIELARGVKHVDPTAEMFGPVSYNFSDAYMVDNKPEWEQIKGNYRWYLDYYLDNLARESRKEGVRLLDVLDIHWYSEEVGDDIRINSTSLESHTEETHKVRVQAPRSMWDPSYRENTWIGEWYSEFLPLIPAMKQSVNKYNPGTKIAFTEYDFGGNHHVSGGIAQADTLGIFGKQGLYMASYWNMMGTARLSQIPYVSSGFKIFNNYDGNNSKYGDTKVKADTNDIENSSIYSSVFHDSDNNLHIIAINKNFEHAMNASFSIGGTTQYQSAKVWAFDENSPQITEREGAANIQNNKFMLSIPKLTVAHIVLSADTK